MRLRCISTEIMVAYFECRFVLLSSLYISFQNSTSMVNEAFWIGLKVANTRQVMYGRQHAPSIICTERTTSYQRWMPPVPCASSAAWGEKVSCTTHEAFVNEGAMYAELRRARPRWGADEHEWLRWRRWARRYRHAPFTAVLGPHNAPPGARGTHHTFPAGSDNFCLSPPPGATRPRVPAASSDNAHHLPHATQLSLHAEMLSLAEIAISACRDVISARDSYLCMQRCYLCQR